MTSSPLDAVEAIAKLTRWSTTGPGSSNLVRLLKEFVGWELHNSNEAVVARVLDDLSTARLYWVTPEMTSLLRSAGNEMPTQTLRPYDLPTVNGFVMFADELTVANEAKPVRAISWSTTETIDVAQAARFTIWFSRETWATETGTTDDQLRSDGVPPVVPARWFDWPFEMDWRRAPGTAIGPKSNSNVESVRWWVDDVRRHAQALFAIITEKYVAVANPDTNRTERRRADRAGWDLNRLQVIDVRKSHAAASSPVPVGSAPVEWSRRWWVSGHWRNQWYPSRGEHRQRYIAPHLKGPEDKPLTEPPKRVFKIDTPPPT